MSITIAVILIIAFFIASLLEEIARTESAQSIYGVISGVLFILIIVANYLVTTSSDTGFSLLNFILVLPATAILAELIARIIVRSRVTSFIVTTSRPQSITWMLMFSLLLLPVLFSFLIPLRLHLDGTPVIDAGYFNPTRIFALASLLLWIIDCIVLFTDKIKISESGIIRAGKVVPWSVYESYALRDKDDASIEIELTYKTKSLIRLFRSMRLTMPIEKRSQIQQLIERQLAVGASE